MKHQREQNDQTKKLFFTSDFWTAAAPLLQPLFAASSYLDLKDRTGSND